MEIKYHAIKVSIDNEFENMGIVDIRAKQIIREINSFSIKLIFLNPMIIIISLLQDAAAFKLGKLSIILFIIELFLIILYISTNSDEEKITPYGADLKDI